MTQQPLVSPHDAFGTNLYAHVLRGRLMRIVPRENEEINETWIADRDRFGFEGMYSPERVDAAHGAHRRRTEGGRLGGGADGGRRGPAKGAAASRRREPAGFSPRRWRRSRSCTCSRESRAGSAASNIDHRLRQLDFARRRQRERCIPESRHENCRRRVRSRACWSSARTCATKCRCSRTASARRPSARRARSPS